MGGDYRKRNINSRMRDTFVKLNTHDSYRREAITYKMLRYYFLKYKDYKFTNEYRGDDGNDNLKGKKKVERKREEEELSDKPKKRVSFASHKIVF